MEVVYETIPNNPNEDLKSTYCHSVDIYTGSYSCNSHKHDYIELVYVESGPAIIMIGDREFNVNQGDLAIINAKETHSIICNNNEIRHIIVKFAPEALYFAGLVPIEIKKMFPFLLFGICQQSLIKSYEMSDKVVPDAIREIYKEQSKQDCGYEIAQHLNVLKIFLWILRRWDSNKIELKINDKQQLQRIENVFDYVNINYQNNIDAKSLAKLSKMSYSFFCREFKRIAGKNFTEYINAVRLTNSIKLMFTTELNMTEIAYSVGFSSVNYYVRKFKDVYKDSPYKYKARFTGP